MAKTAENRLQALEDREALRELQATYCFLVDDGHFDELVDRHFAEDARCDFRLVGSGLDPLVAEGREQVRAFFKVTVAGLLRDMCHTVHNQRIAIEGDCASAESYFELTATDAASGEAALGGGRYIDRYRRRGEGWQFEERIAEIRYLSPLREGWARQRFLRIFSAAGSAGDAP
jgi:ketosteroid isomerase-like protein